MKVVEWIFEILFVVGLWFLVMWALRSLWGWVVPQVFTTAEHVRDEMVQLIAMLYRLWVEGDQVNGVPAIGLSLGVESANLS